MLRLEPTIKRGEVAFRLRERSPFFRDRTLMMAFGIAALLHLSALALLRVPELAVTQERMRSIGVIAEAMMGDSYVHAQLTPERRFAVLPPPPRRQIATSLLSPMREPIPSVFSFSATADPFASHLPARNFPSLVKRPKSFSWYLSGPLTDESILTLPELSSQKETTQRFRYALQVDQQRGRVLSVTPLEGSDATIERAVYALRFVPKKKGTLVVGELEVVYD